MNKCPTCKPIISKTIVCSEPVPCQTPAPCSEILDAACFQYNDLGISLCNTNVEIVQKNDSLELALQKITNAICSVNACDINIDIIALENLSLSAIVTGGNAPYSYKWSIAQGPFVGHSIFGTDTNQTVSLSCNSENGIESGGFDAFMKISNVYLTVTDSTGCVNTVYYYFTSDCYAIVLAPKIPLLPIIESKLYSKTFETHNVMQPMNFMDDPAKIPTCNEIKNVGCDINGIPYADAATRYRADRDCTLKAQNQNALAEHANEQHHEILNYTDYLPGGIHEQLIYSKGGLIDYGWVWGCPACTYAVWHEAYFDCLNQIIELEIVDSSSDLIDGIYENVEFNYYEVGNYKSQGLYFTANVTVENNTVKHVEIVKKGSGYFVNDILQPLVNQLSLLNCIYPDTTIGQQTWSQLNLNVTTYRNGDIIPEVQDPVQWASLTTGAWCYYNNDPSTETTYGKLYNWYAINDPRGLAPEGWRIPTYNDWLNLTIYVGDANTAGGILKEEGELHWLNPNTGAINSYNFTALPGGYRTDTGVFSNIGSTGKWWSSLELDTSNAYNYGMYYNNSSLDYNTDNKAYGCSVRLIKDASLKVKVTKIKENRLVDILPTLTGPIVYLPMVVYPDPFPTFTGNPGEIFKYTNEETGEINGYYAWDPVMQIWNTNLGDCAVDSVTTELRAKKDAYLKALNEMVLAHSPFMSANEYFPFHRWRNEIF